jgi:hypothetical protein
MVNLKIKKKKKNRKNFPFLKEKSLVVKIQVGFNYPLDDYKTIHPDYGPDIQTKKFHDPC